ncbi:hypothetical protein DFJ73DRAFT_783202 [Zopfochytrium polystomum]|nr:hypothetical protein DFJ73DRAFT_783202 [Zopfochytrium polystomum]
MSPKQLKLDRCARQVPLLITHSLLPIEVAVLCVRFHVAEIPLGVGHPIKLLEVWGKSIDSQALEFGDKLQSSMDASVHPAPRRRRATCVSLEPKRPHAAR